MKNYPELEIAREWAKRWNIKTRDGNGVVTFNYESVYLQWTITFNSHQGKFYVSGYMQGDDQYSSGVQYMSITDRNGDIRWFEKFEDVQREIAVAISIVRESIRQDELFICGIKA